MEKPYQIKAIGEKTTVSFFAFDTCVDITVIAPPCIAEKAAESCHRACMKYESLFSRTLPDSDVSRLNHSRRQWVEIEQDTYDLIIASLKYCQESKGLFDITMGSVSQLWDFKKEVVPPDSTLKEALRHVGWKTVQTRQDALGETCLCRLDDPEASLDLGGTAKGWISDRLGETIERLGIRSYAINLGGNVKVKGSRADGEAWRIGIRNPSSTDNILGLLSLHDGAVITSGSGERCFHKNGCFYHHILNPENGRPIKSDLLSVTVIADSGMEAEGWSTTMFSLGRKRAESFMKEHGGIESVVFVSENGAIEMVPNPAHVEAGDIPRIPVRAQ